MIKKDFPDEGELIVGTVNKVQGYGAFVTLDEYPGKEGFIHISEIATGWVIRNHVREKQKVVCKVTSVDQAKHHVDLSLKRVNEHQRRDKIQEWKNAQKSTKLFEMVSENIGKPEEKCYDEFGNQLIKQYGSLFAAFEECAYDSGTLKEDGFSGDWLEHFDKVAKDNIVVSYVEIKGILNVVSWLPDGIAHIRTALDEAEQSEYEDVSIEVHYVGAPRYLISVKAPDYKIAEDQLKKAVDRVTTYIEKNNGTCEFHRDVGD